MFGQKQVQISGHVIDIITKQGVEGAHILDEENKTGTTTDSSGYFSFQTNLPSLELKVSHLSYQTNILQLDLDETNFQLEIQLTPKSFELSEAIITAKRQYKYSVIDFNFLDSTILLLAKKHKNNSYVLFLLNESLDTIASNTSLPKNKQGTIFKDCLGSCHVIFKDSAYQVLVDHENIELIYPVHIDQFYELMENCLFATKDYLVFKQRNSNAYAHSYIAINKETHELVEFISDMQSERMRALNQELSFIHKNPDAFPSGAGRYLAIEYAKKIAYKPLLNHLDIIGDTIYYFDHGNAQLKLFSQETEPKKEIDIAYHLEDNWKSEIVVDKTGEKAYTIFTTGVKYQIHEIDLQNGSTMPKQIIPLNYPEKLKINNGYVYFLYKEIGNIWAKKELYRLKL